MNTPTIIAGTFLVVLAVVSVSVATNILVRGRIYRSLKPASRPRRWILALLLASLGMTFVWLPLFVVRPHAVLTRILTLIWGLVFVGSCFTIKWLTGLVDLIYERKGWPLR